MSKLDLIKAAATANPIDLLVAAVEAMRTNPNDASAKASFEELMQEIVLETSKKWKDFEDRDRPTPSDVAQGLAKLAEVYRRTNNNRKRKLLWNAFWNSFNPEFYDAGIANILWEKVEALEYPDFIFLKKVLEKTDPSERDGWYFEHEGGRGKWRGNQLPILNSEEDAEYAERLSHQGLLDCDGPG